MKAFEAPGALETAELPGGTFNDVTETETETEQTYAALLDGLNSLGRHL